MLLSGLLCPLKTLLPAILCRVEVKRPLRQRRRALCVRGRGPSRLDLWKTHPIGAGACQLPLLRVPHGGDFGRLRETLPGPSSWWFCGRLPLRPPHGGGPGITEKRWLTVSGLARLPRPGSSCLCSTAALCTVRGVHHPVIVSSASVSYRRRALVSHPLHDRLPDRDASDAPPRDGVRVSARLVAAPAVAIGGGWWVG